jgi:hypothetical protein
VRGSVPGLGPAPAAGQHPGRVGDRRVQAGDGVIQHDRRGLREQRAARDLWAPSGLGPGDFDVALFYDALTPPC